MQDSHSLGNGLTFCSEFKLWMAEWKGPSCNQTALLDAH